MGGKKKKNSEKSGKLDLEKNNDISTSCRGTATTRKKANENPE